MRSSISFLVVFTVACLGKSPDPATGKALATRYQCASCHGADLSGSDWPSPGTYVYASNITPDQATGLGAWTDDEIAAAVRAGVDVKGASLCASMPRVPLSDDHAAALVAYLRSVTPVAHAVPPSDCTAVPQSDLDDAGVSDAGVVIVTNGSP